jgi:hypothetical protein
MKINVLGSGDAARAWSTIAKQSGNTVVMLTRGRNFMSSILSLDGTMHHVPVVNYDKCSTADLWINTIPGGVVPDSLCRIIDNSTVILSPGQVLSDNYKPNRVAILPLPFNTRFEFVGGDTWCCTKLEMKSTVYCPRYCGHKVRVLFTRLGLDSIVREVSSEVLKTAPLNHIIHLARISNILRRGENTYVADEHFYSDMTSADTDLMEDMYQELGGESLAVWPTMLDFYQSFNPTECNSLLNIFNTELYSNIKIPCTRFGTLDLNSRFITEDLPYLEKLLDRCPTGVVSYSVQLLIKQHVSYST